MRFGGVLPIIWKAFQGLICPGKLFSPRTRLHGRADRPRRLPLAAGAHRGGRHGPVDREPRVRLGACEVRRNNAHRLKRHAGSPYGVHRVRPDVPAADLLNGVGVIMPLLKPDRSTNRPCPLQASILAEPRP